MITNDIVSELMHVANNRMSLSLLSTKFKIDEQDVQKAISDINHNRKKWGTIQIHRTGARGNSSYELQTQNTDPHVLVHTRDRHTKSAVNHVRINKDIDLIEVAQGKTKAIRMQIVIKTTNRKSAQTTWLAQEA